MTDTRPFPHVEGVSHDYFDVATGVRLHVAFAGPEDGEPVVLLHGWPQHWYMWRRVVPLLVEQGYRCVMPDLRGLGWSEAPASPYSKDEFADDVLALLDALGLDSGVRLVGHDWGAYTGFLCCLRAPARFDSYLALSMTTLWPNTQPNLRTLVGALAYQPWMALPVLGEALQQHTPFVRAVFAVSGGSSIWSDSEVEEFVAPFREPARARAATRIYRTFLLRELPSVARGRFEHQRLHVPTTLLIGESDVVVNPKLARGGDRNADDMVIKTVAGGHFFPESHPEIVAGHLARVPAPV